MAKVQDFVADVERIPGVKGCLLMTTEGRVLARTMPAAEQLASILVLAQVAARQVQTALGLERLRHLVLRDGETSCLMMFPFGCYLLAVDQAPRLADDLPRAIQDLIHFHQQKNH